MKNNAERTLLQDFENAMPLWPLLLVVENEEEADTILNEFHTCCDKRFTLLKWKLTLSQTEYDKVTILEIDLLLLCKISRFSK